MLMPELLTTRVLTVIKGSHLALMTISLAMFGLSAGAIVDLPHDVLRGCCSCGSRRLVGGRFPGPAL